MLLQLTIRASALCRVIRIFNIAAVLLVLTACNSETNTNPEALNSILAEINNESLEVSLEPGDSYEWRVRALSADGSGPWSTTLHLEIDNSDAETVAVNYETPEYLLSDSSDDASSGTVAATSEYTGVPMFSWEHDENALAYEVEIMQTDSLRRVGIFQYPEASVCIENDCQLVLQNTWEESLDLPPILMIGGTIVEGEAPYQVTLPSPVTDLKRLSSYKHFWSIEGKYLVFPDKPEFQHTFTDQGAHTVNLLVTSAEGRLEYAQAAVNITQPVDTAKGSTVTATDVPDVTDGTDVTGAPSVEEEDNVELSAALPVVHEGTGKPEATELEATEPEATEPEATEPEATEPEATEPEATEPEANEAESEKLKAPVVTVSGPERRTGLPAEIPPEDVIAAPAASSIRISWTLPSVATGQIEWGYSADDLDQSTVKEASFKYDAHAQSVSGIAPSTQIFYRVVGEFESGEAYVSSVQSVATTESVAVAGWNDSLPNGGRAIGVTTYSITHSNTSMVDHQMTRRFMATRSGLVKGFKYENRVLRSSDIEDRALNRRDSQPEYYEGQKAFGNDPKRIGYMLGNSYSVGNGGLQEVSIRTDDGNGFPTDNIIAIAEPFIPFDYESSAVIGFDFKVPGALEAGQIYHLFFHNLNPPGTKLFRMSVEEARNAPVDKGAISMNGPNTGTALDPTERRGPFLRDFDAFYARKSDTDGWREGNILPFFSMVYTDDIEVGQMYGHIPGQGAYRFDIGGNEMARQEFTWTRANVTVDRLVTRFGYDDDANGSAMTYKIKNQAEQTIRTGTIPFDSEMAQNAKNSDYWVKHQSRSAVSQLSSPLEFVTGQTYYVEYSAPSGASIRMSQSLTALERKGSSAWEFWDDAQGRTSDDGGDTWDAFGAFATSDLAIYFIPVGVPTQTPRPY